MNRIIFFPHMLGQTKHGVQKTPNYLKSFISKNHEFYNVKCNNNFFDNLKELYKINEKILKPKINIGGDHSMSIATVSDSLNKYKNLKLIWLDAHADINTYQSSNTKNYHGMPLSFLSGIDHNDNFEFIKKLIPMENILYIGIRDLDPFEREVIKSNNITFLTVDNIRFNYENSMILINEFIKNDPIHVSFDVDVMDPSVIHSTGTKALNGFNMRESKKLLDYLYTKNIVNMDITELNLEIGNEIQKEISLSNFFTIFNKFIY